MIVIKERGKKPPVMFWRKNMTRNVFVVNICKEVINNTLYPPVCLFLHRTCPIASLFMGYLQIVPEMMLSARLLLRKAL